MAGGSLIITHGKPLSSGGVSGSIERILQLGARTETKEAATFSTKKVQAIAVPMDKLSEEEKVRHPSSNPAIQLKNSG